MKFGTWISNKSLRFKIMASISVIVFLMLTAVTFYVKLNQFAQGIMSDSYKSNAELNTFQNDLADVERAMELYVGYRTFESIDLYYNACVRVENFLNGVQNKPSSDPVLQKEYIVKQLSLTFLNLSGKTIAARRANSPEDLLYEKTLACYKTLLMEISNLNILLMNKNAGLYMENTSTINLLTTWSLVFFAVFFVVLLVILYTLVTSITNPLGEISAVAIRLSNRDFDVPLFNRATSDEIGNICRAFDRMIVSIREYISTIWEKARTENQLREREIQMQALYADAQLKAFQSQINPHFLFNTLNTGAQLAMMEGADKTCSFIEQTSDFFRYNIQSQKQEATVSEELGLVDNFVYIMKVRFGKRLEFEKDIPPVEFNQLIPMMTLQPLVENCIKHGLQNTTGKVLLKVTEDDDFVYISVSDNGCGMDAKIRESILERARRDDWNLVSELQNANQEDQSENATSITQGSSSEKHAGIGLINVLSRLRLFYHRDDIFDIMEGDDGTGTKFLIRVPKYV